MENLDCCFLLRLPRQYFTLGLINHHALKNILNGRARRCCEKARLVPLRLISNRAGWKSHITTGAAGAGWPGRDNSQQTEAHGRGEGTQQIIFMGGVGTTSHRPDSQQSTQ